MNSMIRWFKEINVNDNYLVGDKNVSLGEWYSKLMQQKVLGPNGFVLRSKAYWTFLEENNISHELAFILDQLDTQHFSNLSEIGHRARNLFYQNEFSYSLQVAIIGAYQTLMDEQEEDCSLSLRTSVSSKDLPMTRFVGEQESYLNVSGENKLLDACLNCYASLFADSLIKYRVENGLDHMKVALSIGVQQMLASDKADSVVVFTVDR